MERGLARSATVNVIVGCCTYTFLDAFKAAGILPVTFLLCYFCDVRVAARRL